MKWIYEIGGYFLINPLSIGRNEDPDIAGVENEILGRPLFRKMLLAEREKYYRKHRDDKFDFLLIGTTAEDIENSPNPEAPSEA